ncbi:protein broad-minded-like [Saccostrea echinata]|uniref:protein broad-minded-like n=1 Tax=Saccostrea echinata TaxID=191078 RepID=UPI002A82F0F4|nr:protein broad-minded-like [Saccostrea echinata]
MAWRGLEGEDLKNNIRQLVIDFEPHIREAGNFEIAEETLLHLEENEQHFHRFEFVKQLKRKIDEALSPLIEDEIEKFAMAGQVDTSGQETLVSKITQCVIHSKPYCDMSRKMKRYITEAVEELIKNFDAEFGSGKHKETSDPLIYHRHSHHVDSDEEESSYDSSFHQGMLLLPNSEELQSVADKLHKSRDIQSKTEAMQILNQNMPADFINSDYWPQIRKNLLDVMTEPEELLTHLPLKFITRAFVTTSPQTREIYTMLAEYLIGQFQTRKGTIPKIKNGLDITNSAIAKLLKAFRLLNEFQQETTNYWIRYPDRYIEEILESTLNLFSIHQMGGPVGTSAQLSPIHFIAIIDPKAQWFIKWMHGNYSRHRLLKLLEKYRPIVVNAVRHCLDFSANRKLPFDLMSDFSDTYSKINVGGGRRSYYAGAELEYAYFIHSVHLLGRLLCFTNGRKFFPIKLKDSEDPITIKKLLVSLVLVVVDPSSFTTPVPRANSLFYEPATLVTEILKILCSHEQTAEICLYKDEITTALLSPVSQFLDAQCNKTETEGEEVEHNSPGESTLLHIADIVSMIASSTKGRRHLMYGERKDIFTRTKSSAAHIIAKFTKKALLGEIPRDGGTAPSKNVIGAYLYICRQLYNTCEGLLVLYQYELHNVIVRVWKEAFRESERTVTPTPSDNSSSDSDSIVTARHGNLDINAWEDTLRDNLLNFASSAKGLLLLQQTGAMNECMSYMYARYEKKLQVSKCEKFGYGYMVTQVAATAPGMIALQKTGYIKSLISEMWSVLECGASDTPLFTPKSWSVDTIDRSSHKHLIRLLNVLSAFPAVYEVLANKPLPSKPEYGFREIPTTIVDFVDRLIMVDSDAKIHSLFNFEQSHTFGLRVLSVMICCLDTFLLLQSQYNFQEILLSAQEDNHYPKENIILDLLSLERNHILVRSYLIGGPSERILPPRTIDENKKNGVFSFPLFSSYPVPREYVPSIGGRSTVKQESDVKRKVLGLFTSSDNDLAKFLSAKKPEKGQAWLDKCKTLFSKMLISKPDMLKGNLLQQLLEVGVPIMSKIQDVFPLLEYTGTDSALKGLKLSPLQKNGIKMAIRYGLHLKVIHNDVTDRLAQLLRQCSYYLKQQQKAVDSSIEYLHSVYGGFDWFAATIFLMFGGNLEKSWNFLHKFSTLGCSGYLWIPRLHCSVHLPSDLMCSGISPLFSSTGHNIELILQIELPLVASAFKMSGFTPAQICFHWLKQCFWNYLDWTEICQYVCLCIVMGIDYQVYLCCSILKHLQKNIMEHMQTQELIIYLKENAITGFHSSNYMTYMIGLEKKYRDTIFRDMLNITRP